MDTLFLSIPEREATLSYVRDLHARLLLTDAEVLELQRLVRGAAPKWFSARRGRR